MDSDGISRSSALCYLVRGISTSHVTYNDWQSLDLAPTPSSMSPEGPQTFGSKRRMAAFQWGPGLQLLLLVFGGLAGGESRGQYENVKINNITLIGDSRLHV